MRVRVGHVEELLGSVERETGRQPIAWPWYVRWLAVAYVLSYFFGVVGFLALSVAAAVLFAWHPRLEFWGVFTVTTACACPAACAAFRWWFRSWGQRRWPNAKPADKPVAAPDTDRVKAFPTTDFPSRYFFLGIGILCVAVAGMFLAHIISRAVADSRLALHGIPTEGTVVDTRITRVPSLQKEGLVEYTVGDRSHRQWLVIERPFKREPQPGGIGTILSLFYDPVTEEVREEPPNPVRYLLGLPPFSFLAVLGLFLSAAMTRLLLKGEPLRSGPPYPDITLLTRSAMLVFGGLGALAIVVLLYVVFAFASLNPSTQTPSDRWHSIQVAIGANCALGVMVFLLLTGLLVLCVKAIGRHPQMAHNTGRHLLLSSGLAMAMIAVIMSLVAIGFGFG